MSFTVFGIAREAERAKLDVLYEKHAKHRYSCLAISTMLPLHLFLADLYRMLQSSSMLTGDFMAAYFLLFKSAHGPLIGGRLPKDVRARVCGLNLVRNVEMVFFF
jgi:hypothetical protein